MKRPEDISNEELAEYLLKHTDWYEEYAENAVEGQEEQDTVTDEVAFLREAARRLWELDNPYGSIDNPEPRDN